MSKTNVLTDPTGAHCQRRITRDLKVDRFKKKKRIFLDAEHKFELFRDETPTGELYIMTGKEADQCNKDMRIHYAEQCRNEVKGAAMGSWRIYKESRGRVKK